MTESSHPGSARHRLQLFAPSLLVSLALGLRPQAPVRAATAAGAAQSSQLHGSLELNATQAPFLVEAALTGLAAVFGILTGKGGKPYGKVNLLIHLFFYVWLTFGFGFIVYGVAIAHVTQTIWVLVTVMGIMIVIQLFTAVLMLNAEKVGKGLPLVHIVTAFVLGISEIGAFIIAGLRG